MALYDVSLGGIALPTYENDFTEEVGGAFELVGSSPMPGPPVPLGFYTITIDVYGDPSETNPTSVGLTKRNQVRSLLQNDALRYAGIAFSSTFDSSLDGYLVIGTADIAYAEGGPTFGDFQLKISGAAHIGAPQTLLGAARLVVADRTLPMTPIDRARRVVLARPLEGDPKPVSYLPVGAADVVGQAEPRFPGGRPYATLFGEGLALEGRQHGELLTFERAWEDLHKGDVRILDRRGQTEVEWSAEGDADPEHVYGWVQAFGPGFPLTPGDLPALDNGVCRVRLVAPGKLAVDSLDGDRYKLETGEIDLGYQRLLGAPSVVEWTPERAAVRARFASDAGAAEVVVALQRGWRGPSVDLYRAGELAGGGSSKGAQELEQEGWRHVRLGASRPEFLADVVHLPTLVRR